MQGTLTKASVAVFPSHHLHCRVTYCTFAAESRQRGQPTVRKAELLQVRPLPFGQKSVRQRSRLPSQPESVESQPGRQSGLPCQPKSSSQICSSSANANALLNPLQLHAGSCRSMHFIMKPLQHVAAQLQLPSFNASQNPQCLITRTATRKLRLCKLRLSQVCYKMLLVLPACPN